MVEILSELVLQVIDLEIVLAEHVLSACLLNISNDVPGVLVIYVQLLSMKDTSDMLSKQVEKELILLFLS